MMTIMIIDVNCPNYTLDDNLDLGAVAARIDNALFENFEGKDVVLRAISSAAHTMPKEKLVSLIEKTGYDRYDPEREGDRYENINNKHIDFFGLACKAQRGNELALLLLEGFHIYGSRYHGRSSPKMDIWLVYDKSQLKEVVHQYEGRSDKKRDGFVFRDANAKPETLLGILNITSLDKS
jgi:uncharacterized ferredoxin-like protein